ncbi:MAG: PH domain-containing protein [Chloroflexota bacterium]
MFESLFQPDLGRGERILWTGQPDPNRLLSRTDLFLVPFSLVWGGFALYWEATVLGWLGDFSAPPVFAVFGLPFVLFGLYLIVGRFFYLAWIKRRTYYAVTSQRALILRDAWGRSLDSFPLQAVASVSTTVRQDGSGTIVFGPTTPFDVVYGNTGLSFLRRGSYTPAFFDVPEVRTVAQIIQDQQASLPAPKQPRPRRR